MKLWMRFYCLQYTLCTNNENQLQSRMSIVKVSFGRLWWKTGYCQLYVELVCCVFQWKCSQPHWTCALYTQVVLGGLRYLSAMLKIFGYIFLLETHQVYGHGCNGCKGRTRNVLTSSSRFGTPSSDATVSLKQDHRSWRGFWDKNVGFATKCENLFTCIF